MTVLQVFLHSFLQAKNLQFLNSHTIHDTRSHLLELDFECALFHVLLIHFFVPP